MTRQSQLELGGSDPPRNSSAPDRQAVSFPELPGCIGGLNETTLHDLYGAYRTVSHAHYDGTAGFSEAEKAVAWRAIMLTYPELLAAAHAGLAARNPDA